MGHKTDDSISIYDLCTITGLEYQRVYTLIRTGRLPARKDRGPGHGRWWIEREVVRQLLKEMGLGEDALERSEASHDL